VLHRPDNGRRPVNVSVFRASNFRACKLTDSQRNGGRGDTSFCHGLHDPAQSCDCLIDADGLWTNVGRGRRGVERDRGRDRDWNRRIGIGEWDRGVRATRGRPSAPKPRPTMKPRSVAASLREPTTQGWNLSSRPRASKARRTGAFQTEAGRAMDSFGPQPSLPTSGMTTGARSTSPAMALPISW